MPLFALKWTTLVFSCSLLVACAPQTRITTNKASDYTRDPKRVFVLTDIGDEMGKGFRNGLQRKTIAVFQRCGIDMELAYLSALELDESIYAQKIAAFGPDSILTIKKAGGTKDQNGLIVQSIVDVKLTDVQTNKLVWRANMNTRGGFGMADTAGEALAVAMTSKMREDQILKSCPNDDISTSKPAASPIGQTGNSAQPAQEPRQKPVSSTLPPPTNSITAAPEPKPTQSNVANASTGTPAGQPVARPTVAKAAVMGPFKPGKPLPLTLDMVRNHTWRYPHPTDFDKNGNIELVFSDTGVQATSKRGGSMGSFELRDGALCLSLVSWTSYCVYVVEENGQKMVFFTGGGGKAKLTIE